MNLAFVTKKHRLSTTLNFEKTIKHRHTQMKVTGAYKKGIKKVDAHSLVESHFEQCTGRQAYKFLLRYRTKY